MKIWLQISFLLLLSILSTGLNAQNVREDLIQINKTYKGFNELSVHAKISYFSKSENPTPTEEQEIIMEKMGKYYYYKVGSYEAIRNKRYYIMVDHKNKAVIVDSIRSKKSLAEPIFSLAVLDSTLALCQDIESKKISNTEMVYSFNPNNPLYTKLDLHFNPQTFIINKIVYYLKGDPDCYNCKNTYKLEMTYTSVNTNPAFPKNYFSELKFATIVKRQVKLNANLQAYTLYNQLK